MILDFQFILFYYLLSRLLSEYFSCMFTTNSFVSFLSTTTFPDYLMYLLYLMCICCICVYLLYSYVYLLYYVCIDILTLDAGLLARSQYPEGPATGHLDTGFSWFPCVYKRMLRWFQSFRVAATCFSCSPPDLNFLVTFFLYLCTC